MNEEQIEQVLLGKRKGVRAELFCDGNKKRGHKKRGQSRIIFAEP